MTNVSKGLLAKKYAENLVEALLQFASKQNQSYSVMQEIKVEWIGKNQLLVTGVSIDKKGKKCEGTTLKVLQDLIQNNNPQLITSTRAKIKAKSEKDIERYIIEHIRNSIRYLEELKLLKDQRPRNREGKVAGTPYWTFKLINLKDNGTLEENLEKVRKKLEIPPSQSYLLDRNLINTRTEQNSPLSPRNSGKMSGEIILCSNLNTLAQQMRGWFDTLGYHFEKHEVWQDSYFEWIINIPVRRNRYDRVFISGITGELGLKDVRVLSSKVKEKRTDEGWLVTDRRISKAAHSEIRKEKNHNLECFTFDELVAIDADFSCYLNWLEAEVKKRGIDKCYVPLACRKEELDPVTKARLGVSYYTEEDGWIDGYIDRWLDDPAKEHISILGEFGTGKTWFVLHYAWVALQRYRDAKHRGVQLPRLPLVISLRDYAKAVDVESLFSRFFFRQHEIPIPGYSAFEQLNQMGKLLLIFDGFDEMASRIDRQEMINNFWELAKVVVPGAKVILTCRTEHFPEAREGRALLNAELQASVAHLSGETPQFEVLELEKFNKEQIRQLLSHQAQDVTVEKVMGNSELLDLARRPVMTELILEALPDIEAGKPVDMSRVYLYAVKQKMQRDIKVERTFTSLADKLYFLCELSWEMLSTDQMSLNYRQFPDRIRRLFGATVQEQKDLDHWHYDMMGQTMLIRNADGDYTPAHRSLLEFFVAYKFAAEFGVLADDFTELAQAQRYLNNNPPTYYTWSSYFRRHVDAKENIVSIAPLQAFVRESLEKLLETVGRRPLTKAVMDLLVPMVGDYQALVKVLEGKREKSEDEVGYVGGNATTLALKVDKRALEGRDLSGLVIKGADFSGASLRNVNFVKTSLKDCIFTKIFGIVLSVAFSPVNTKSPQGIGTVFATADINGLISLWEATSGREIFTCFGHSSSVFSIAFSPDGMILASGSRDQTVRLWDLSSGECLHTFEGHTDWVYSVAFSPDGKILASSSRDQTVRLWNLSSRECLHTLKGHTNWVYSVAWSPQGNTFASGSRDRTIRLWDLSSGECLHILQGHTNSIYSVGWSPQGDTLASGSGDQTVRLWNPSNGECLHILKGHANSIYSVAWNPQGGILASGSEDETLRLWDLSSRECLYTLEGHTDWIYSVAWSPQGDTLTSSSGDQTIRLWEPSNYKCFYTLQGHTSSIYSVAWSPQGDTLASSSGNQTVQLWDLKSDRCLQALQGHNSSIYCLAWSPYGDILAVGSIDRTVRLWELSSGECLQILRGHTNKVRSVAWSPQGDTFASGSDDLTIRLWKLNSGESIHTLQGHTDKIRSVAWSPRGDILASGSDDQTVQLWELNSGESIQILKGHASIVRSVNFSPDAKILASCSDDQTVKLWEISTGKCLSTLEGHTNKVRSLAWSSQGDILASGSEDKTVRLWKISTGKCLYTLEGHTNWVRSVDFGPNSSIVASGSEDGTVRFWDANTGKCVKILKGEKPYEGMNISGVKGLTTAEIVTLKALGAIVGD
ncbi:WD40 domain-containing protein [Mastigocoleus testarum]|uniref:NACHT domain-containing protein n=1 Tax=Mastigocoleus testarum BC008 TaxID=371196 RepID=A0A0V7ZHC3_9CYAN|nr:NACHT domain-containing protein [Mastigocoleus testarum]KST63869.1 hypothetical protein BC008_15555 [Mastigocoleus testarum BC008]KST64204.1 hypothetical protein BC008_16330 [Mastigocoleus testarum BC008]